MNDPVFRNSEPAAPAVLSCTDVEADGARNAIPTTATIRGDTRRFTPALRSPLDARIRALADGICAAHRATSAVAVHRAFGPTVNDPTATDLALATARSIVSADACDGQVEPWTASEDVGVLADEVPGCLMLLGTGPAGHAGGTPLHGADDDLDDDVLEDDVLDIGVRWLAAVARRTLADDPRPRDSPEDLAATTGSAA